jgi:hypothetical protein
MIFCIRKRFRIDGNKVGQLFIVFNSAFDLVSKVGLCSILAESHTHNDSLTNTRLNTTYDQGRIELTRRDWN